MEPSATKSAEIVGEKKKSLAALAGFGFPLSAFRAFGLRKCSNV